MPITAEVSVRFYDHGDFHHATLTVRNDNPTMQLTVIHENSEITAHEAVGTSCTEPIACASGESLIFISRFNGQIVASSIFEVDCECADYGFLLSPRGGFNLIVYQDSVPTRNDLHQVAGSGVATAPPGIEYIDILVAHDMSLEVSE